MSIPNKKIRYNTYRLLFLLVIVLLSGFGSLDGTFSMLAGVAAGELHNYTV
jgi:hypothetical protein